MQIKISSNLDKENQRFVLENRVSVWLELLGNFYVDKTGKSYFKKSGHATDPDDTRAARR